MLLDASEHPELVFASMNFSSRQAAEILDERRFCRFTIALRQVNGHFPDDFVSMMRIRRPAVQDPPLERTRQLPRRNRHPRAFSI